MYKIIISHFPNNSIIEKHTSPNRIEAEELYRKLMWKREFWCKPIMIKLSYNNRDIDVRRFDKIIPIDEKLAEKVKLRQPIPDWPRYLFNDTEDKKRFIAQPRGESHILCYADPSHSRSTPLLGLDPGTEAEIDWSNESQLN